MRKGKSSTNRGHGTSAPRGRPGWLGALVGAALLTGVVGGALVVRSQPVELFGLVLAVLFGTALLWIMVSVLWPARADRDCPQCGSDSLARIDPRSTVGLRCEACDFRDETASAWLLAEEEGPLEATVLRQRREQRRRRDPLVGATPLAGAATPPAPAALDSPLRTD